MLSQELHILPLDNSTDDISPSYAYLCKVLKYGKDFDASIIRDFVMIRRYDIINGISYDTDIYFIQPDLIDKVQWPAFSGKSNGTYSSSPVDYNGIWRLEERDKYKIYTKDSQDRLVAGKVPCDILKIYHPVSQKKIDAIVDVSTTCNSINVHLLCQLYDDGNVRAEESFYNGNEQYSEYREFLIPSIDWMTDSGNAWYMEDMSDVSGNEADLVIYSDEADYVDMATLKMSFTIDDRPEVDEEGNPTGKTIYSKLWVPKLQEASRENNVTLPLRVCVWPCESHIDDNEDHKMTKSPASLWIPSGTYASGTVVLEKTLEMSLSASFGFNGGAPSIITKFIWPEVSGVTDIYDAYKYFYGIDLLEYQYMDDNIDDEDEEDIVPQKMCHFDIKMFSDYAMKSEVWSSYVDIESPDDFAFRISNVFNDWKQFPEIIIMQTRFVDRWLGNIIKSNPVLMTASKLKYLITEWQDNRVKTTGTQDIIKNRSDMDLSKTNFIDKVTCVIRKAQDTTPAIIGPNRAATKVLYKPVFYKTKDLHNIQLYPGITQNIGVNLAEYMTKVETFVMRIGEQDIVESARNDAYVIFKVDTTKMAAANGRYYISNQDGEFISTGNYIIN